MSEPVGSICFTIAWFLLVAFLFLGVYALFKAVANRKPGVGYFTAVSSWNLLIGRSDTYTDEGDRWRRIYLRCMLGFMLVALFFTLLARLAGPKYLRKAPPPLAATAILTGHVVRGDDGGGGVNVG